MRASHLMWAALTIAVGVALFLLKYKVQALEHELVAKQERVIRDEGAIRVLQAEWTYLNDPERLRRLSEEYLSFRPAQNVIDITALPFRAAPGDTSPSSGARSAPHISASIAPARSTEVRMPSITGASTTRRPSVVSAAFARLQRLLLPTAAGATTLPETSR